MLKFNELKQVRMKKILLLLTVMVACNKQDDVAQDPQLRQKFLVDKIYDYHNNVIAEYSYNDNNQLVKRETNDPINKTRSDYDFEYENGRIQKIIYTDYNFPQFNHDIVIKYDRSGNITRDETYQHGKMIGSNDYSYDDNGKIKGIVGKDNKEYYTINYAGTDNAVQASVWVEDGDGSIGNKGTGYREIKRNFSYDHRRKPDFGLGSVFQVEPLPQFGTEALFEKNISKNNMTEFIGGTRWIYQYNSDGLPETIETKWKDVETTDPMIIRLEYRPYK